MVDRQTHARRQPAAPARNDHRIGCEIGRAHERDDQAWAAPIPPPFSAGIRVGAEALSRFPQGWGDSPPDEAVSTSYPIDETAAANSMLCSTSHPPGTQSVADSRIELRDFVSSEPHAPAEDYDPLPLSRPVEPPSRPRCRG